MKNKKSTGAKSIFEKRGFYIALYSCLALVLVSAIGITYSSLNGAGKQASQVLPGNEKITTKPTPQTAQTYVDPGDSQVADGSVNVEIASADDVIAASASQSKPTDTKQISEAKPVVGQPAASEAPSSAKLQPINEDAQAVSTLVAKPEEETAVQEPEETDSEETQYREEDSTFVSSSSDESVSELLADPVFNTFTGNEEMAWPVLGDIVMNYSIDALVYDKTLDQYRTNDTICIAADVGEQVKASADGVVRSITNTRESGNTIVIEHGNGWYTTYSQLQDGILVAEGDVVTAGQVIGGVGTPSIYSVLLGNHLSFKVTKDEATINPSVVLVNN